MKITVITKPISKVYNILKLFQIFYFKIFNKKIPDLKWGGHPAVTRSIVEGLEKIGAEFNYNPKNINNIGDVVYVPGGRQALKWAIKMKQKNKIKKLVAGPNHVVLPSEKGSLIKSKYIDLYLTNSQWVKDFYLEDSPELVEKIAIWPAGVNTDFWKPDGDKKEEKKVILYYKRPITKMFNECKKILELNGYDVETIYYGDYNIKEYREMLNCSTFLVHFVEQESQGLSLLEAWSMNVPTLVWNPGYYHFDNGKNYFSSSAPYLTENTGKFFKNSKDFEKIILDNFEINSYCPRDFVLKNMSDEVCAYKLIKLLN